LPVARLVRRLPTQYETRIKNIDAEGTSIKLITRINMRKKSFVYGKVIFYESVYSGALEGYLSREKRDF
jgi:hypothetical protein